MGVNRRDRDGVTRRWRGRALKTVASRPNQTVKILGHTTSNRHGLGPNPKALGSILALCWWVSLCRRGCSGYRGILQRLFCWSRWQQLGRLEVHFWSCPAFVYCSATAVLQENRSLSFSTCR